MKNILIVGKPHVGKSTLINRLIETLNLSVSGYMTKREKEIKNGKIEDAVYIYEMGKPMIKSENNLVARFTEKNWKEKIFINKGAFDNFAPKINELNPPAGVILFDEIGFLESQERQFCKAVLDKLDGDIPVIAAVQSRTGVQFLEAVKRHKKSELFCIDIENRDEIFERILEFLRSEVR